MSQLGPHITACRVLSVHLRRRAETPCPMGAPQMLTARAVCGVLAEVYEAAADDLEQQQRAQYAAEATKPGTLG